MNIGKAIKEIRKEKRFSQQELSAQAGITQAALSAIENGARPNPETLTNLCKVLKVPESLVYVLGMEKTDVPVEKQIIYDELFPVIASLVMKVAGA